MVQIQEEYVGKKLTVNTRGEDMANYDFDIGILGGGAAGLTVASGAAQLGAKTLM